MKEIMSSNKTKLSDAPAVYCGTYGKYNDGSLAGKWVTLTDFDSYCEFIEYCKELHSDEDDPELMFQDYENFPEELYFESGMSEEIFDKIIEYSNSDDKEALDAYIDLYGIDNMDAFEDKYMGQWDSEEAFAQHIYEECYEFEMSEFAKKYFDITAFARDLFMCDFDYNNGYVFNCY